MYQLLQQPPQQQNAGAIATAISEAYNSSSSNNGNANSSNSISRVPSTSSFLSPVTSNYNSPMKDSVAGVAGNASSSNSYSNWGPSRGSSFSSNVSHNNNNNNSFMQTTGGGGGVHVSIGNTAAKQANVTRAAAQFLKPSEQTSFWQLTLKVENEQACRLAVQHIENRRQSIALTKKLRLKEILEHWSSPYFLIGKDD